MVNLKNTCLFATLHLKILYNCNSKQLMMGKKNFAKICIFIVLMLTTALDLYAQDPQFSQFYANPVYLNPAFAGTARCPRVVLNYRNQWPGIPGNFVTSVHLTTNMWIK